MPDDPGRDPDDLDHALFDTRPGAPSHQDDGDLDVVLFGTDETTGTGTEGAAVGYAAAPLSRGRRVLVGVAVVAMTGLVVMATVAFASGSDGSSTNQVRVPSRSNVTSTAVVARTPSSLPGAGTPDADTTPATTDRPAGTTATTRQRTTPTAAAPGGAGEATPDPLPALPPLNFPTDPDPTTAPTTTQPPTTTTTEPTTTT